MNPLARWWYRRRLRDQHYAFMFEAPPEGEAVCLDCEASRLSAKTGELLSIGAIHIRDGRLLTSSALRLTVRPRDEVGGESILVHGLRNIDVATGLPVEIALDRLLHFIGPRPVVGYYIDFDMDLIDRYLRGWLGIRLPNRRIEVASEYYHWRFGRLAHRPADLRLETILKTLELPSGGRHDAYHDALTAGLIHLKLAALRP
ncbi:MAG: 3'-5' exonuclease [Pseudomonadota bacterium]